MPQRIVYNAHEDLYTYTHMYNDVVTMGSRTIPVRLESNDLREVDLLVKLGVFNSRSEALRELIRLGVKNLNDIADVALALKKLFELEKTEGGIPLKLPGATRHLLAERDRFL